jgi:hypothetical protein
MDKAKDWFSCTFIEFTARKTLRLRRIQIDIKSSASWTGNPTHRPIALVIFPDVKTGRRYVKLDSAMIAFHAPILTGSGGL